MRYVKIWVVAVVGVVSLATSAVQAVILTNVNTVVTTAANNSTITQWTVDGTNQYVAGTGSWFYRVGAGPLVNLDTIAPSLVVVTAPDPSNPFDFTPTSITSTYLDPNAGLQFTLKYVVAGGNAGSQSSSIQGTLTAQATGGAAGMPLSIFESNDLAVNATEVNDLVMPSLLNPGDKVNQFDSVTLFGEGATSKLTGPGATLSVSDPTHREAGLAAAVAADVAAGLLTDTPPAGVSIGPGNVAYAFQYDFTLTSGTPTQSVEIDVLRNLSAAPPSVGAVPEPVSAVLGLLGLAALGIVSTRRRTA